MAANKMKYILVTGGVISGVGKGIVASSFGTILKCCGINVTLIKVDPYINIDAGTFSPLEHGEVYVLDDGSEVDQDLGNYERFLDVSLHKHNNITTGKIYQYVINKERKGEYLGKTVQVVPHITDAIQEWVIKAAHQPVIQKGNEATYPDVCIVELGGTTGDIEGMPFFEAFRQFQFRVQKENFCCVHVSLVPQPKATGEAKTKPTQCSVKQLRALGLSPDLIVCRSEKPVSQNVKEKISNFCHVPPDHVLCFHDVSSIYKVPLLMEEQNMIQFFNERLNLNICLPLPRHQCMSKWKEFTKRIDRITDCVNITLVGKYTQLEDAYASVTKALQDAATASSFRLDMTFLEATDLEQMRDSDPTAYCEAWEKLRRSDGVIVPGGFGGRGSEGKILACQWCREKQKPFLGICLGFQVAVIEFARNVLGYKSANSTEIDPETPTPVVIDMPEHNQGQMGGTMRLGKRVTVFGPENAIIKQLYGNKETIEERHRHRYEVNPKYVDAIEEGGLKFIGRDEKKARMQVLELPGHPYFVATQFHAEYLSRPLSPSPPFLGFILASTGNLKDYLARGCRMPPKPMSGEGNLSSSQTLKCD